MGIRHLITQVAYRIEPKPEGGFIARARDPNVPPLEAPTREELLQQVQAKIAAALNTEFPGLKIPITGRQIAFRPGDDLSPYLIATPADETVASIKAGGGSFEHQFAEDALARPGRGRQNAGSNLAMPGSTRTTLDSSGDLVGNSPITPEGGNWRVLRFLLVLVIVSGLVYFFFHR